MQKNLLTNGNAFKRTDGRWGGVVWYMDESGERKRKSFSGTTKQEVNKKMTEYIANFEKMVEESDESKKTLFVSMQSWLEVFKYPSVERPHTTVLNVRQKITSTPNLVNESYPPSNQRI